MIRRLEEELAIAERELILEMGFRLGSRESVDPPSEPKSGAGPAVVHIGIQVRRLIFLAS